MARRCSIWIGGHSIRWQLIAGVAILQTLLMTLFVVGLIRWQEHILRDHLQNQWRQRQVRSQGGGDTGVGGAGVGDTDLGESGAISLQQLAMAGLLYTLFAAGIGTLFAWLLARTILSPLRVLQDGVERFGANVLEQPIPITGANEVAIVSRAFNEAMHRLAQQQQQLRDEMAERARTEQRLSDLYREADEVNKTKDHFLAILSHELRSPLTPVLTLSQMLERDTSLPESVREDITVIRSNVEAEVRLIDDLMDLTRIKGNKVEMRFENVNVHENLREVVRQCQREAAAKKLELNLELWADQAIVRGDGKRLGQLFSNLLRNAIKFTPMGGRIAVQTHRDRHTAGARDDAVSFSPAENDLLIDFCDSGVGIEPAMLSRIFEAFEQGSREAKRVFGGLGLGLTISRALVQLHGGELAARSEGRDRGSTFTVRLPLSSPSARPATSLDATDAPDSTIAPAATSIRRILLVEDHPATSRATARLLSQCGYHVQTAESVASAIRLTRDNHFDLIVSDIGLPDGTGHQLIRQLVAEAPSHEVKGIAISGLASAEDVRESEDAGFIDHLVKPIDPKVLLHLVEDAIGKPK